MQFELFFNGIGEQVLEVWYQIRKLNSKGSIQSIQLPTRALGNHTYLKTIIVIDRAPQIPQSQQEIESV